MKLTVKVKREAWGWERIKSFTFFFYHYLFFYFFGIRREIIVRSYNLEEEYKEMKLQ